MQGKRLPCEELFYDFKRQREVIKAQEMETALFKISAHQKGYEALIP